MAAKRDRTAVDFTMQSLESIKRVSDEYGIPTGRLKPCIAYYLDGGNIVVPRHIVAFTLAMELRRLTDADARAMERHLRRWAGKVGYGPAAVRGALRSALRKDSNGKYCWNPPGLRNGPRYAEVLQPICDEVGCPANCPAFSQKFQGPQTETFDRFTALGWPVYLKRRRWRGAIDVYQAVCDREKQLQLAPGVEILTSYAQLKGLAQVDKKTVGASLRLLAALGLLHFTPGSGSGPHARDREASRVRRVVPIPPAPRQA